MENWVLDTDTLPELLYRRIHSKKVAVREEDGMILLIPIEDGSERTSRLLGMFPDGRLSTKRYLEQKRQDMELER